MSLFGWLLALTYLGLELYHRQRSVGHSYSRLFWCSFWRRILRQRTGYLLPQCMEPFLRST